MTSFNYKARDRYGVLATGTMESDCAKSVAINLSKSGYSPVSISPVTAGNLNSLLDAFQKVAAEELIVFTRQLSSILGAGIPLLEGLQALYEQVKNTRFKKVIFAVKNDIEAGTSFSEALSRHKQVFSPLMVSMVRAGEAGGILDKVLDDLSKLLEKDADTVEKLKSAMRYPMMVLIALSLAFVALTIFVIPRFVTFFGTFDIPLPLPTRILIGTSYCLTKYGLFILAFLAALLVAFKKVLGTEKGRMSWDRLLLSVPLFGPLSLKINLSRFCCMLSAMLRSGIPILEALFITSSTVDNKIISKVILDVREEVSKGKNLASPMAGSHVFPPIATSMVAIGEKAGTLEEMLNKISEYFDREADYAIKNLIPLLEPIMILGLGFIMLFVALGIFMPMWDMVRLTM